MATVKLSRPYDFLTTEDWAVALIRGTKTHVTVTEDEFRQEFDGNFSYGGGHISGSGDSTEFYISGELIYTMKKLNLDARTMEDHVRTANDAQKTNAYVLREDDKITGSTGDDTLSGYRGNDNINGGVGADRLLGAGGSDRLNGGSGNDTLTGGGGADEFRFVSALSWTTNVDIVTDFKGSDVIQLDNAVFRELGAPGGLKAANFKANSSGTATDGNDYILYDTDAGALYYDADGSGAGASIRFAVIGTSTHPVLKAADFDVV